MRIEESKPKTKVITLEEEYTIPGTDIVLEAGDKIEIPLEEDKLDESHLDSIRGKFAIALIQAYDKKGISYVQQEIEDLLLYTSEELDRYGVQSELIDYLNHLANLVY